MPVSKTDRERLRGLLAQNGLTPTMYKSMTTPTLKRRAFSAAMSRDPANKFTPWATLISDDDRAKIQEAFINRI